MPQTKALYSYLQITYKLLHRDHDVANYYEKSMERNASKTLQYQQLNMFTPTIEIPSRFPKHTAIMAYTIIQTIYLKVANCDSQTS